MDNQTRHLIDEIKQLRTQYLAEIGDGGRKPWPKSIKERVLELCRFGMSASDVSKHTEIPYHSVLPWRREAGLVRAKASKKFHALTVTDRAPTRTVTELEATRTVTVEVHGVGKIHVPNIGAAAELVLKLKQGGL